MPFQQPVQAGIWDTLKEAAAQKCATEAIGKTRFPKPDKKKPVSVTASLSFKKG